MVGTDPCEEGFEVQGDRQLKPAGLTEDDRGYGWSHLVRRCGLYPKEAKQAQDRDQQRSQPSTSRPLKPQPKRRCSEGRHGSWSVLMLSWSRPRAVLACLALLLLGLTGPAAAHEFWIEPKEFRVEPGSRIVADLKVGQHFRGGAYPYLKSKFVSFKAMDRAGARDIKGDEGDTPALMIPSADKGLKVIWYLATPHRLEFDKWEDFVPYLEQEGLGWVVEAHKRRGLPESGFTEEYTRCAKALVQVGEPSAEDQDLVTGMPLELIAEKNPYIFPDLAELPVRLLWQGKPIGGIQITTFQDNGTVTQRTTRTDPEGRAVIFLQGGGRFLLNAVHVQEAPPGLNAAWESYWASLTFAIQP